MNLISKVNLKNKSAKTFIYPIAKKTEQSQLQTNF